jgi:beta-glucanase (GH16 family)
MIAFSRTRVLLGVAFAACCAGSVACSGSDAGSTTPTVIPPLTFEWTQVWSDEFDGPAGAAVDATKWGYDLGDGCAAGICGWGNLEKEVYTSAPENIALNGQGQLAIVARRAAAGSTCFYGACRYTSAKITTRGKMAAAPGRVEARIKLPAGQGLWPAFWMLGNDFPGVAWPACGEFDIMENKGSTPSATSSAVHGPGYSGNTPFANVSSLPSGTFGDDFHVFAVEWDASKVQFSVDGAVRHTVSREEMSKYGNPVLDKSYFVILNLAVGGNFDGDPKSDTIFPATMLVDYVRVFGLKVK